ncbi:MAG: glutaredoxin 3 [Archangium gephyra]|uniref:Glutaredoxin n=1 Tax=Archangium gephyra TaxID=48 RepID=A0A2W5V7K2_9BACT|nr:MAG: glutaredoxin 3 [Archangium gephyra]
MKEVIVYTKDACPYCRMAERFLEEKQIPFKNIDVTDDQAMRDQIEALSGQRTVPQIFVGGESIGGYSDMMKLHQKGEFEPKLGR